MKNLFTKQVLAAAVLIATACYSKAVLADTYAIVVNVENAFMGNHDAMRQQVKRLYLKEQSSWPGGIDAVPFGRADDTPEQQAFSHAVLQMSAREIEDHWLHLKQVRGETPPRGIGSRRILARQIAKMPGAFGVVLASEVANIKNGKMLFEFSID